MMLQVMETEVYMERRVQNIQYMIWGWVPDMDNEGKKQSKMTLKFWAQAIG